MCSCYTSQFELLGNHHYGSLHCHLPCAWLTGTTVKSASVTFPLNYPWMLKLYSTSLASTIVNTGTNSLDTEIVWQSYNKMIQNIVIVIFKIIIEIKWHKFLRVAGISDFIIFGQFGLKFYIELMGSKLNWIIKKYTWETTSPSVSGVNKVK